MACFIVPLVEAAVVSAVRKINQKRIANPESNFLLRHLPALEKMLWGGSVMLIVDHIINDELTWKFPFFTALGKAGGLDVMLSEMLKVGLPIAVAVTLVWVAYAAIKDFRAKKSTQVNLQ